MRRPSFSTVAVTLALLKVYDELTCFVIFGK